MASDPYTVNLDTCTLSTCPLDDAILTYRPTIAGNATYLAIFALFLIVHAILGIRYRTWGFLVGTACCYICEITGYAGRLVYNHNPFPLSNFLLQFIPIALAPAFLTGAVYVTLGRYIIATSPRASYLKPRTITISFITCDITSLILQAVGGALTSVSVTDAGAKQGTDILTAGLALQVVGMAVFLLIWALFAWRLHTTVPEEQRYPRLASIRRGWTWKGFQPAIFLAMIFIFIRCMYRVVELNQGFGGALANDEVTFMALEGPMIVIASALLTIWHPGFAFKGKWNEAAWRTNGKDDVGWEKRKSHGSGLA